MSAIKTDLKVLRARSGWTFDRLAIEARCSPATCRMLLSGWRGPTGRSGALERVEAALARFETDPEHGEAPGGTPEASQTPDPGGTSDDSF